MAKLDLFLNITNYMNTTHSYTCIKFLTRIFFSSKSIPISHNPSGRWDKCRHFAMTSDEKENEKEDEKKRKSLASPLLSEVRVQHI